MTLESFFMIGDQSFAIMKARDGSLHQVQFGKATIEKVAALLIEAPAKSQSSASLELAAMAPQSF